MSSSWCIVTFVDDNTASIIPEKWIEKSYALWPPATMHGEKVINAIKNKISPCADWRKIKNRMLNKDPIGKNLIKLYLLILILKYNLFTYFFIGSNPSGG